MYLCLTITYIVQPFNTNNMTVWVIIDVDGAVSTYGSLKKVSKFEKWVSLNTFYNKFAGKKDFIYKKRRFIKTEMV